MSRIAPVASFAVHPHSSSLSAIRSAGELCWSNKGDRIYFEFGGTHFYPVIGYLSLTKSREEGGAWDNGSGYDARVHWLRLSDVFNPRVCPNGRTLSFVERDVRRDAYSIWISDLEGRHARELIADAMDFDWRPRSGSNCG